MTSTTVDVVVSAGQTVTATFGNQLLGTLVARIFEDVNANGVWDTGEAPLPGVTVAWVNEFGATSSVATPAGGILTWPGLPAGVVHGYPDSASEL